MYTALARHTRYHYTIFLHIKTLKESKIFKHHLNLCYSGVILTSDLVILPGLFWFLGSCFSVKDWVQERFGRLLENSGTGFSLLKNRRREAPDVRAGLEWADAAFTGEMGFTLQTHSSWKSQKEATFMINSCGLLSRNKRNKWQTTYTGMVAGLNYLKVWKERINFFHLQFKTQCFLMYVDFVKIIFLCSS